MTHQAVYPEPPYESQGRAVPTRNKVKELIDLAREPSSDRRRELLRQITDLFFVTVGSHGPAETALFDDVLTDLAHDLESEVQAELAARMSTSPSAPGTLMRHLALAPIGVAEPVLAKSKVLSQDDLLHVVATRGQAHLRAVSGRDDLSAEVSEMIVERGDDDTLSVLLRNDKAALSRKASEAAVDRAGTNAALHAAVVGRRSLPIDLLNEMYFLVEARLRDEIMARNASIDPEALEAALAVGRKRLAARDGALPEDFAEAEAAIRKLQRSGPIPPAAMVAFLRGGERTKFLVALSECSDIDFPTARRIVERKDLDALAIICKAAGFDRALFLTFAVLILDPGEGMAKALDYGRLFSELPKDAALRTLRFWRMRRTSGDVAAA